MWLGPWWSQMNIPKYLWTDAIICACYLINRMPSSMVLFPFSCLYPDKPMFTLVPRVCFVQDSLRSIKWSLLVKDIIALIRCIISILIQLMLSFLRLFHSFLMTVRKPRYWVFLFLSLYLVLELKRYSQFLNHYNYILKDQRYRHLWLQPIPSPQLRFLHISHNLPCLRLRPLMCLIIMLLLI